MTDLTDDFIQSLVAANAAANFIQRLPEQRAEAERLVELVRRLHTLVDSSAMSLGTSLTIGLGVEPIPRPGSDSRQDLLAATSLHLPELPNSYLVGADGTVSVTHDSLPTESVDTEITYVYAAPGREYFITPNGVIECPAASYGSTSFGGPYYHDLERALSVYETKLVKPMMCFRLRQIWVSEDRRLGLVNSPEHIMRDSLTQFLTGTLRQQESVLVLPEQNVDESHPVDIRVEWDGARRLALIEIKWLGKSQHATESRFSTTYTEARAVEGLEQLANYIDAMEERSGWSSVMGYLTVFDARRSRMNHFEVAISRQDGLHYSGAGISYPQDLLDRHDMGTPLRWFMAPASGGLV